MTAGVLTFLLASSPLAAVEIYVTRWDDQNNFCAIDGCSLREAIKVANGNDEYDTIYLPKGTIELSEVGTQENGNLSGDLDITKSVTIVGKGPGISIVDANGLDRVFHIVDQSVSVIFQRLTITGGGNVNMGSGGGGILVDKGVVVCLHCDIAGNLTAHPSHPGGGVLVREGTLWLQDSSVRNNIAAGHGGGIEVTGIPRSATLQIDRSTFSGNQTSDFGAAIVFYGVTAQIHDSTIVGNTASGVSTSAVYLDGTAEIEFCTFTSNSNPTLKTFDAATRVTLKRTIIRGQCETAGSDTLTSEYGNLESPGNTCGLDSLGDKPNVSDPLIYPLGLNGGPTETRRPDPSSPAVDAVFTVTVPGCPRVDQRGVSRPQEGDGQIGVLCDIGAVELIENEIFLDGFEIGYTGAWSDVLP
jgi:hypothetical protein